MPTPGTARSRPKCSAKAPGALLVLPLLALGSAMAAATPPTQSPQPLAGYQIVGDAIPVPLVGAAGDAARGRAIVADRQTGLCLLCHSGPFPEVRLQGNLAPDLAGVGSRLSAGQIRLRLVDSSRVVPDTIMPAFYRVDGLNRVGAPWRGKPILSPEQIEDVVAYLASLS